MDNTTPSTEERIWAVLAHGSALAFGMGILLPIVGWSEQRRKSKYASFQCLQALGYQALGYTLWLLSCLLILIGVLVAVIVMSYQAERDGRTFDPTAGPGMTWLSIMVFVFFVLYMILPVAASIATIFGKDFRYPVMGNRLAKFLGFEQTSEATWLIEEHEDRWVAAMGHFSAIILLWGMLAPATVWILQARRNAFLKFQSVQSVLLQAAVTLLYFGGIVIYLMGFSVVIASTSLLDAPGDGLPIGLFGFVLFIVFSLIAFVMFLLVPLFHILGQWAGYRVLKGDNYRYPIIGRLVERWMAKKTPLAAEGGSSTEGRSP